MIRISRPTLPIVLYFIYTFILPGSSALAASQSTEASDDWLIGKWELFFDPDGSKKDYIEFKSDGDAISHGPLGEVEGLYIVSAKSIKAVFTYQDKDFIMTFFFNEARDELRIVTSHTGRESIYKKIR